MPNSQLPPTPTPNGAKPRTARTSDGYTLVEQPDGTWSDGDLVFESLEQLLQEDPDTVVA